MGGEKLVSEALLALQILQSEEPSSGDVSIAQLHRARKGFFRLFQKRCRICHRPPNVLYYDSPRLGFLCADCHARAMTERLASVHERRRGP